MQQMNVLGLLFVTVLCLHKFSLAASCPCLTDREKVCTGPHVELFVSPVIEEGIKRPISFAWTKLPKRAQIGIFDKNPVETPCEPLFTFKVQTRSGWRNTTLQENHTDVTTIGYKAQCLPVYIAYRKHAKKDWKGLSCLRTEPTWMADLKEEIGEKTLSNLFIPGSHNAVAYSGELSDVEPSCNQTLYNEFQDESVLAQLIYGSRYLDISVGHYPETSEIWWGIHEKDRFYPLKKIIDDVKLFLENTEEIVIFDVHYFPVGFVNDDVHEKLVKFLEEELKDLAVPFTKFSFHTPLKEIWNCTKKLVIGYNSFKYLYLSDILWPGVKHMCGNIQKLEDLITYLDDTLCDPPCSAWSAMANLKPRTSDIAYDTMKGTRHAAEVVSHNITEKFRGGSWAEKANIVSVDFLRGTGIVRAAIQWNKGDGPCHDDCSKVPNE